MLHKTPPSPKVLNRLYNKYKISKSKLSFKEYLIKNGLIDVAKDNKGMDDNIRMSHNHNHDLHEIDIPHKKLVKGKVYIKVLLVDFPDLPSTIKSNHYRELLFSKGTHPTGSLYDYFKEVSLGKIEIEGTVSEWITMPNDYSYYTNNSSGTSYMSYPKNAQGLAEDAVKKALENNVVFPNNLDVLDDGNITALFIIHSGFGAEELASPAKENNIWSHKWNLRRSIKIKQNLFANTYLTVPHNAKVGVCAHELGHLVFQWQDFYDVNNTEDNSFWSGTSSWDLMASGSWNGSGLTPAHPIVLHKNQHDWLNIKTIAKTTYNLSLAPINSSGQAIKIISKKLKSNQYFLLENRTRIGFDKKLKGEGLLIWRIDEDGIQSSSKTAGALLIQADGMHDLETSPHNRGDEGDPFPGIFEVDELLKEGNISTSFPRKKSDFEIKNITKDPVSNMINLDIVFDDKKPEVIPELSLVVSMDIRGKGIETFGNGYFAGRKGWGHRTERFSIKLSQDVKGLGVSYKAVSKKSINSDWAENGHWVGIKGKRITSFIIKLTGSLANKYQLKYSAKFYNQKEVTVNGGNWCESKKPMYYGLKGMTIYIEKK